MNMGASLSAIAACYCARRRSDKRRLGRADHRGHAVGAPRRELFNVIGVERQADGLLIAAHVAPGQRDRLGGALCDGRADDVVAGAVGLADFKHAHLAPLIPRCAALKASLHLATPFATTVYRELHDARAAFAINPLPVFCDACGADSDKRACSAGYVEVPPLDCQRHQ